MDTPELYPVAYICSISGGGRVGASGLYPSVSRVLGLQHVFSACTHQRIDRSHGCHGMLLSGLACQRWGQLPLHPTFLNRNWPKLEMSSRQRVHKQSKFPDSVHQDNWHLASYCCFIQTAPTLDSTYIKNEVRKTFFWQKAVEGLLSKWKIVESATLNFLGPLPWRQDVLPAQGHQVSTESWMSCQWLRRSRQLKLAASILARFANGGGISSTEMDVGT